MAESISTANAVQQREFFEQLQTAAFSKDYPAISSLRRQLAAQGIRITFDADYQAKTVD